MKKVLKSVWKAVEKSLDRMYYYDSAGVWPYVLPADPNLCLKEKKANTVATITNRIEFTEEAVKEYLDMCIKFWRKRRDSSKESGAGGNEKDEFMAICYIDCFQSVRTSLFGEVLLPYKDPQKE